VLRDEGYFAQRRGVAEVVEALANKGANFKSKDVATACLRMTQAGQLAREPGADGSYVYWDARQP
jgi:hypothetical protein